MVEPSKTLNQQPKTTENLNIMDIKSVAIEYLKTSRKLFKTIRQAKNVFEAAGATKNSTSFLMKKILQKCKNIETISCL